MVPGAPQPPTGEVAKDVFPFFRVYKDGRVERFKQHEIVPPSDDAVNGVRSKDVIISPENQVAARLFIPSTLTSDQKLPILIYIHGGGFFFQSAFSPQYTDHLNKVVAEAQVLAVSIDYRLAPEHPIPACYDDSWTAIKWVASQSQAGVEDAEPWIKDHGDFSRVFLAGDSAGANIAHNMVARATTSDELENGLKFSGMALIHPFFGDGKDDKLWSNVCSDSKGVDDPRLNPMEHPSIMAGLDCRKIVILTAEKDFLRGRGWLYYEALKKSGWDGELNISEIEGEDHVFHLLNPTSENAGILLNHFASIFA